MTIRELGNEAHRINHRFGDPGHLTGARRQDVGALVHGHPPARGVQSDPGAEHAEAASD